MRAFAAVLVALLALPAAAAVYIVPDDATLVRDAGAIVTATATAQWCRKDARGSIETVTEFRVDETMKGGTPRHALRVVEPGGVVGDDMMATSGSPRYEPGRQYLLFLDRRADGDWRTHEMELGRFEIARDLNGAEYVTRGSDPIFGWDPAGNVHVERPRRAAGFRRFIRDVVAGRASSGDYAIAQSATVAAEPSPSATYTGTQYVTTTLGGYFARRPNTKITWYIAGDQTGLDLRTAAERGVAAWDDEPNSTVEYTLSPDPATGNAVANDGEDRIIANDPNGFIPGSFTGSGTLALTQYGCTGCTLADYNGETYIGITYADMVIQDGVGASLGQTRFDTTVTHELGHSLGFRHSDKSQDDTSACVDPLPCSNGAIMRAAVVSGIGSTLQSWDVQAIELVYGDLPCDLAISSPPVTTTVNSSNRVTFEVIGYSLRTISYQWYEGVSGDTSSPVSGATTAIFTTPVLSASTNYWVRLTTSCGTVDSETVRAIVPTPRRHPVRRP